jgi:hypothetical protein
MNGTDVLARVVYLQAQAAPPGVASAPARSGANFTTLLDSARMDRALGLQAVLGGDSAVDSLASGAAPVSLQPANLRAAAATNPAPGTDGGTPPASCGCGSH